jgi:hypothetical protein
MMTLPDAGSLLSECPCKQGNMVEKILNIIIERGDCI